MSADAQRNNTHSELVTSLEAFITRTAKSQNLIASETGISAATLSNMRSGKHEQISEAMWRKLSAYLGRDSWQVMETPNFKAINAVCADAQRYSRFLAISDFSGAGKSTALRYYHNNRNNVSYVLCNSAMSPVEFIDSIARAVGASATGSKFSRIFAITDKLNSLDRPLLILDDFGKVNDKCYQYLQMIYDATERSAGIVIAGTEYLRAYVDRSANRNKCGFREFKRRVALWHSLQEPSDNVVRQFCQQHNLTDEAFIRSLCKNVHDYGTLREAIDNEKRRLLSNE